MTGTCDDANAVMLAAIDRPDSHRRERPDIAGGVAELTLLAEETIVPYLLDDAWALYFNAFNELNALAAQRHLMTRAEFDTVMGDKRVWKYVTFDERAALCGLGTFTNDLDAVPLISPRYFERQWPAEYAERRIWYVGFVAAHQRGRAGNLRPFHTIVAAMIAAAKGGLIGLDLCTHNESVKHLPRAVNLMLARTSGAVPSGVTDRQSYWLFDLRESA
jgi:hypothetical protein